MRVASRENKLPCNSRPLYIKAENNEDHVLRLSAACAFVLRSNMGDWLVTNLLPRFARLGALPSDIMILNFAVWINKAEELAANVMMWAEYYQRFRDSLPFTIWRDASIQHFDTPTGALPHRLKAMLKVSDGL